MVIPTANGSKRSFKATLPHNPFHFDNPVPSCPIFVADPENVSTLPGQNVMFDKKTKTRVIANYFIHALLGFGCFAFFWLAAYGAEESGDWSRLYWLWSAVSLIAFVVSYFGGSLLSPGISKIYPAVTFSFCFIVASVVSFPSILAGGDFWKVFGFWASAAFILFVCSYCGGLLAARSVSKN